MRRIRFLPKSWQRCGISSKRSLSKWSIVSTRDFMAEVSWLVPSRTKLWNPGLGKSRINNQCFVSPHQGYADRRSLQRVDRIVAGIVSYSCNEVYFTMSWPCCQVATSCVRLVLIPRIRISPCFSATRKPSSAWTGQARPSCASFWLQDTRINRFNRFSVLLY